VIDGPPELFTTAVFVLLQPFASLTVMVYVAADKFVIVCPVAVVLHEYVSDPVPPLLTAVTLPLLFPQVALTGVTVGMFNKGGTVIVVELIALQPLPSVTVT